MSDFAASSFNPESTFDASSMESNLQSISAVEATWRSPKLPDEVKLDLAMQPGVTPGGLTSFLQAVDSDMAGEDTEIEEEAPPPVPVSEIPMARRSGTDLARVVFSDVAGSPAPTAPDEDAVIKFKEKAIRGGYLPEGTSLDHVWSPELNNVRYEMAFDDYDSAMRGDRYGAVDARNFLDVIGDWTQPSSLLAAATELDLFWDFGSINSEFSSWGDKFRKLQKSNNPWEFGKNLVDAVTGPIDDVVMPIVNWGLIASGVGGVYNTARLGAYAGRLGRAGSFVEGLYKTSSARALLNMGEIKNASWTAQKLLGSSSATANTVGRGLASWRNATAVSRTKQAVQAGMRLGVASQAENLLPGYQGGHSLHDITQIGDAADRLKEMGMTPLFMPIELAVAPYNIFSPGTFIGKGGAISKTAKGLYTVSGTVGGRAAIGGLAGAAVGTAVGDDVGDIGKGALLGGAGLALAPSVGRIGKHISQVLDGTSFAGSKKLANGLHRWVGTPSDFLETMSFKPLADNQKLSATYNRVYRRVLTPEQTELFDEGWAKYGTLSGAVGHLEGVDEETGAAIVTWRMMTAALDNVASGQAKLISNGSFRSRFHNFRNSIIGQLRTFDLNDVSTWTLEDLARSAALTKYSPENPQKFNRKVQMIFDEIKDDPAKALELANTHNQNAQRTLTELLSPDNLSEEALFNHLGQTEMSFGRWPGFASADHQITEALHSGLLDEAEFATWMNAGGNQAKFRAGGPKFKTATRMISDGLNETVIDGGTDLTRTLTNRNLSTLAAEAPTGRMTVALADTPVSQDLMSFSAELKHLRGIIEGLESAAKQGVKWDAVEAAAGAPLSTLNGEQLKAALMATSGSGKFSGTADAVVKMANRLGMDPQTLIANIDGHLASVLDDTERWVGLGMDPVLRNSDRTPLQGLQALKKRIQDLDHEAHYTAAQIDVEGLIRKLDDAGDTVGAQKVRELAEGLEADGYKLVYGKEFIMPHDLLRDFEPFKDITTRHLHAETMGNVFRRRLPAERRFMEESRQKVSVARALGMATGRDVKVDDPEVKGILGDLRKILEDIQAKDTTLVDNMWQENWFRKRLVSANTSFTPLRMEDLVPRQDHVIEGLISMGHDRAVATAIWEHALPKMRSSEFQDVGLYAIEAWLRKNNQGAGILKFATGAKGKGLLSGRGAYTAGGAYVGYQMGADYGPQSDDGSLGAKVVGAVAGAAAGNLAARGVGKLANAEFGAKGQSLIRRAELNRHGYMADALVRGRDAVRFTLSPFFDISRYTEGLMLAQTAAPMRHADGTRMALHLNMSPSALRKRYIKETLSHLSPEDARRQSHAWFDEMRNEFRHAARGDYDPTVLDDAGRWYQEVGIMGFNPTDWMTSAFIEMKHVGKLDSKTAYQAAKEMYTYGTTGRSAAEMSVNFVLFPFSFQKKALTHVGKWMNQDLGRSIMIHDAYKAYQELDEKWDLNDFWRDHAPVLEQLQKLNLFAYGLSGGRLGGINRQYIEPFIKGGVNYAQQLFMPTGASIKDAVEAAELQDLYRRAIPAINDINWMTEAIRQQTNVFTSESHVTIDAEIRQGYKEWNEYREEVSQSLRAAGASWGDLRNKPYLESQWAAYEAKRAELGRKYPAWFDSRTRTTQNRIALEIEKNDSLARAAAGTGSFNDNALAAMEQTIAQVQQNELYLGHDFGGDWEDASPEAFRQIQRVGVEFLRRDRRFASVWHKFYRKQFGPLESEV